MDNFTMENEVDYSKWERTSIYNHKVKFSLPNIEEVDSSLHFSPTGSRRGTRTFGSRRSSTSIKRVSTIENAVLQSRESRYKDVGGQQYPLGGVSSPYSIREIESACSSLCHHLPKRDEGKTKVVEKEDNSELIQMIKFQIKAKKQCVLEYKKQILNLMQDNVGLKAHIQGTEVSCHTGVREQLEKYHKLRDAVENITNEHIKQKALTDTDFDEVKRTIAYELKELEKKVSDVKRKVERQQRSLKTLNNYKNKEYPEKTLIIKRLKREIDALSLMHGKTLQEMDHIIEVETARYKSSNDKDMVRVLEAAASLVYDKVNPNLLKNSFHNAKLKKEIEIQRQEKARLEQENLELERKIEQLIDDINEAKVKSHPGVYQTTEKCMPDTEYELSIPRKKCLPI